MAVQGTANDNVLQQVLIKTKWDVNAAVDQVFQQGINLSAGGGGAAGGGNINQAAAEALFDGYKTTNDMAEIVMDDEGIARFMGDLGLNAETDIVVVQISHYMDAKYMGEYQKAEFLKGCAALGCDSIQAWKAKIPQLRQELTNDARFTAMYKYAFTFAQEKGKRNVEVELACALWDLLIGQQKCGFLEQWKAFVTAKNGRGELNVITADTWNLFYDLCKQTGGDLRRFEDDGCWPALVDEFIEANPPQ